MPRATCFTRRGFLTTASAGALAGVAGCDEAPSLVSDAELAAMGERAWAEIREQIAPSREADLTQVTAEVSTQLLRAAGEAPSDWEVQVFASPQINAFALPGGKIGVYEGMFQAARTRDQLAAIIGHEIGHLQAEHSKKRVSAQIARDAGVQLIARVLEMGDVAFAREIAAALGVGIDVGLVLPYNRDQELEADALGLMTMNAAGFNAAETITLWERMTQLNNRRSPEFLATHPSPGSRIAEIEAILPSLEA